MDAAKKERVARFLNDVMLSETIYNVLLQSFLKPRARQDVQLFAAARLAIDLLEEGWKDLNRYRSQPDSDVKIQTNPAV